MRWLPPSPLTAHSHEMFVSQGLNFYSRAAGGKLGRERRNLQRAGSACLSLKSITLLGHPGARGLQEKSLPGLFVEGGGGDTQVGRRPLPSQRQRFWLVVGCRRQLQSSWAFIKSSGWKWSVGSWTVLGLPANRANPTPGVFLFSLGIAYLFSWK